MATTDLEARNAKPKGEALKGSLRPGAVFAGQPQREKYWRLKYRFAGKEKVLALIYPETPLKGYLLKKGDPDSWELRQAEWAQIDLEAGEWNIPGERMKMKQPHLVPLSSQALAILRELRTLTGNCRYLFPSGRSSVRPMSNNAVNAALRRMGFEKDEMTGHGFRAMARTILDEVLQIRPEIIEHQLAHSVRDPLGRAYNGTTTPS